jgi:taurine dioxygenase
MTLSITPFDAALGAQIDGIDAAQALSAEAAGEIRAAIYKYQVVLFPGQDFTAQQQLDFARSLGPVKGRKMPDDYVIPETSREVPGIAYVSNIRDANGIPTGVIPDGEMWFHHDTTYVEAPDRFTMLYAIAVPKVGGNTMWANMYSAWETLPRELRQALDGCLALNVYDYATVARPDLSNLEGVEHAWQPAIVTHPVTARKAIFVNRLMTCQIEGMTIDDSLKILNPVFEHAEQRQFIYEHTWTPGDFIIWDNLACTHARTHFKLGDDRRLRRCKVNGERLIADLNR